MLLPPQPQCPCLEYSGAQVLAQPPPQLAQAPLRPRALLL